jgi:hypothetical protein
MIKSGFALAVVCATALVWPVSAQEKLPTQMGGLVLSAWGGGAAFSDLQRFAAEARWQMPGGEFREQGFARRLTAETSPSFGVGVAYWFSQRWGVRVQAGMSPSRLEITVPEDEVARIPADSSLKSAEKLRSLQVSSLDAQVLYRLPFTPGGLVAPYALAGVGALRWAASGNEPMPPEALQAFAENGSRTRTAAVLGLGVLIPMQRHNYALSFELTDHLALTPFTRGTSAELQEGKVTVLTSRNAPPAEGRVHITNQVRILVGVALLVR